MIASSFRRRVKNYALVIASVGIVGLMLMGGAQSATAISGYTYKVSSSQVLTATGSVAYTGSSFTAALNWALSHANTVTYVPSGTYTLTTYVHPAAGTTLYGDGDSTVFTSTSTANKFNIEGVNGVTMSSFKMTGSVMLVVVADVGQTISGITLNDIHEAGGSALPIVFYLYCNSGTISGITYNRCTVTGAPGYGWMADGTGSGVSKNLVTNWVLNNCAATDCGRYGQAGGPWITGYDFCEGTKISNVAVNSCTASGCWESGFHIEYAPSTTNIVFTHCVSNNNGQKPASYNNGDGTRGPQYGMGFIFKTSKIPSISFSACSGTGNAKGLSPLSPGATTLNTVSGGQTSTTTTPTTPTTPTTTTPTTPSTYYYHHRAW